MASIKFIRDTSITHALPGGGRKDQKIARGTVWDDVKESSANWWCGKGDAVRVNGGSGSASRSAPSIRPAAPEVVVSPFVDIAQGINDGDFERVFEAFRSVSDDDIQGLPITDDARLVLTAARGEVEATGGINDVSLPDLTDAADEALRVVQAPQVPAAPALPMPKAKAGRPKRA